MTLRFADPWLLVLAALPLLSWLWSRRRTTVPISSLLLFDGVETRSWRSRLRWIPDALWFLALLVVILAVARPQKGVESTASSSHGRQCMLLVDVSGSMAVVDPGQTLSRLDRMKTSVREAIRSSGLAASDAIGLVLISESPRVACPLTTDRDALEAVVDGLEVDRLHDRTNLGDAVALALDALQTSGGGDSRILVYSDGAHNVAEGLTRMEAARIAQARHVPISAVPIATRDADSADIEGLRQICEITGGVFGSGGDTAADLDEEGSPVLFPDSKAPPRLWTWRDLYPQFLLAALGLLIAERLLRWVILRNG